jgi:hypothetical protein
MNLFLQGMRRSGTTIVFDIFWEDHRFDCYYEPLAALKPKAGGGSGVHDVDLFANVHPRRDEFLAKHPALRASDLNYGAPRDASLEFEDHLPDFIRDYLRYLISKEQSSVIKCTRMAYKIADLVLIDPDAGLVHIVRDPRAVTTSYLMGRGRRHRDKFQSNNDFFGRTSLRLPWSAFAFSEYLLASSDYLGLQKCPDFMRILLIWKHLFRVTHSRGTQVFGSKYLLLRHEDLQSETAGTINRLYQLAGKPPSQHVLTWAESNVKKSDDPYAVDDPRWQAAFERLEMTDELVAAGYL